MSVRSRELDFLLDNVVLDDEVKDNSLTSSSDRVVFL